MNSCLYEGVLTHARKTPVRHAFRYQLMMCYLNLDELGDVFTNIPLWRDDGGKSLAYFNRQDYLSPQIPSLKQAVLTKLNDLIPGHRAIGAIYMLTHLRMLGICFNPVTFYYCYDENDLDLSYLLAEITNTPWGERHCYAFDIAKGQPLNFAKAFHVSPFIEMDMDYEWSFTSPSQTLNVNMNVLKHKQHYFNAHLDMQRCDINSSSMMRCLLRHGFMNYKVVSGIYWQALKLALKRVPFYPHPKSHTQ